MAQTDLTKSLKRRFDKLKTNRQNWETHWQEVADYMLPRKADVTKTRSKGDKRTELIFDSSPLQSVDLLAASLHGMLTNPSTPWFNLRYKDVELENDDEAKLWLESATDAMYVTDEATDKYTHKPVIANDQTAAEMNVYLINDQYTRCNLANCSNKTDDQDQNYPQGSGSSTYQSQHADGSSDADHVLVYELTTPYTVALISPTIDISFGTSAAVGAQEVNSLCQIWAEEPVVTITIN